jgi:hypothetical protein
LDGPPASEGGGGTTLLASKVLPELPPLPDSEGGGGTTLGAEFTARERPLEFPDAPTEGGGATTFVPSDVPAALCTPRELPFEALELGGGGTMLEASEVPEPPGLFE